MNNIEDHSEVLHLEQIVNTAREQLDKARNRQINKQQEILDYKKDQRDNTEHQLGNLYSNDGFEALVELSQYAQEVSLQIDDYEMEEQKINRLKKIIRVPYFSRIDFKFEGEEEPEQIYIGRFTLTGGMDYEIKVYDWRSPIASVFYRYGTGEASYSSPNGMIHGEVTLKRQYEIKDSHLEYYFDAELEIMDEFLKKMLTQNATKAMHAIVETIQKDQDVVIRDMSSGLMMVQGTAGSGKTSVALHRAAFLMYQGLTETLHSDNILILSPNSLFEQYISRVLPELGEENVVSYIFEEIIDNCIHPGRLQSYREFLELLAESKEQNEVRRRSFEYKTSSEYVKCMAAFASSNREMKNPRELYLRLLEEADFENDIREYTLENLGTRTLYYEDALCICFLQLLQTGTKEDGRTICHVIIDEVQDYTPLHFEILKLLYPQASYTTLGDINQSISRRVEMDFYHEISKIINKPKPLLVTMNKSFRCSRQILEFAAKFLDNPSSVESFCRDGDKPEVYSGTPLELELLMIKEIETSLQSGYESVALVCENQKSANELKEQLSGRISGDTKISVVKDNGMDDLTTVFTIPLYMAKGLEFDSVLVVNVTERQHLYIASTRALHRLTVFQYL